MRGRDLVLKTGAPALSSGSSLTAQVQALFASRNGGMWDFSDMSTLRQDAAGTTLVTAVTHPVGLAFDISVGQVQARRNLINYTEDFSANWTLNRATSAVYGSWPISGMSAKTLIPTAVAGDHGIYNSNSFGAGQFTFSVYAKANGYPRLGLRVYDGAAYRIRTTVDLSTGTVVSSEAGTTTIEDMGSGVYRVSCTGTSPSGSMGTVAGWNIESLPSGVTVQGSFTGDGVSGAIISGAQVESGELTAYQRVLSASSGWGPGNHATQATAGLRPTLQTNNGKNCAQFDGTDDALLFPNIAWGGSFSTFVASNTGVTSNKVHIWRTADAGGGFWGVWENGSGVTATGANAGSPTYAVNGVTAAPSTRGQLYSMMNSQNTVLESIGVTLSAVSALQLGGYVGATFSGPVHRVLMIEGALSAGEKLLCRQWCAEGIGITL